ncbi:hypothetical protein NT6N_01220 [Oceaniferula spumae]|uniref:CBM-cenC domain-containing protein n=1 Tax=Oceaniferula spumae TaxID=2979115 RepID=A0AAT9FGH9_9BACT
MKFKNNLSAWTARLSVALFSSLTVVSLAAEKNLVENGDFGSKKLKSWEVGVTKKYGQDLDYDIKNKGIHFKAINGASPKYVTLSQYIEIKKGKKYRVSFEAMMGKEAKGKTTMSIGRPGFARPLKTADHYDHLSSEKFEAKTEWTKFSYEFTGTYDSDNKEAMQKDFKASKAKAVWKEKEQGSPVLVAPTWIVFNLGGIDGDFSLRNVMVVEVE